MECKLWYNILVFVAVLLLCPFSGKSLPRQLLFVYFEVNMKDFIAIFDLGSLYNERLVEEIKSLGAIAKILANDTKLEDLNKIENLKGIIVNGGEREKQEIDLEIYNSDFPVLLVDHMDDVPLPDDEGERLMILNYYLSAVCGIDTIKK